MSKSKELRERFLVIAIGKVLSCVESTEERLIAFGLLNEISENDEGDQLAAYAHKDVVVWKGIDESITVDGLIEIIEDDIDEMYKAAQLVPKWVAEIDWDLLRKQKRCLVDTISSDFCSVADANDFQGIVNTLDALQDWVVEIEHKTEEEIFNLENE